MLLLGVKLTIITYEYCIFLPMCDTFRNPNTDVFPSFYVRNRNTGCWSRAPSDPYMITLFEIFNLTSAALNVSDIFPSHQLVLSGWGGHYISVPNCCNLL